MDVRNERTKGFYKRMDDKSKRGAQLFALRKLHIDPVKIDSKTVAGSALKAVLRAIDDHGGNCWASADTIAEESCLAERTVRYAIRALRQLGYINCDFRQGRTSLISINWNAIPTPAPEPVPRHHVQGLPPDIPRHPVPTPLHPVQDTPAPSAGDPGTQCRRSDTESIKKRKLIENPLQEDFEKFWKSYPRRENKPAAHEAFTAAVAGGADPAKIISAAVAYAEHTAATERQSKFIKLPANWLTQERWNDELPTAVPFSEVPFLDGEKERGHELPEVEPAVFLKEWNAKSGRSDTIEPDLLPTMRQKLRTPFWKIWWHEIIEKAAAHERKRRDPGGQDISEMTLGRILREAEQQFRVSRVPSESERHVPYSPY
jgi:Helix-turn-helix domain